MGIRIGNRNLKKQGIARSGFSRQHGLEEAIARIERQYPQFRQSEFSPKAGVHEAKAFEEYRALREALVCELQSRAAARFIASAERKDAIANAALARMGLTPVLERSAEVQGESYKTQELSLKEQRGEISEKVIREVKFLKRAIPRKRTKFSFSSLRDDYTNLRVLEMLSCPPFNDEDREFVCYPNQWEVGAATYATGILKRYFGVASDETIRSYRKAYKARFRLEPGVA